MKRFVLLFLAFAILLPGFACAMPVCGMEKKEHCPHHMDKAAHGLTLMQDCAKADFQKTPDVACKKPDSGKIPFTLAAIELPPQFETAFSRFVRGPPPEWPPSFLTKPPILLTTQRFRE